MNPRLHSRPPEYRYIALLSVLLAGCASHPGTPPVRPADQTVDAFIGHALNSLTLAQAELARTAGVRLPPAATPAKKTAPSPALAAPQPATPHGPAGTTARLPHLRQTGTPPSFPPLVTRSGRDRTLTDALRVIVPPDWQTTLSPPLRRATGLRWDGGTPWPQTLDALAVRYHLVVTLNWTTHRITADRQAPCPAAGSGSICTVTFRGTP